MTPLEFLPWEQIPADLRREADDPDDREVFGVTFTGTPAWIPWMGQP